LDLTLKHGPDPIHPQTREDKTSAHIQHETLRIKYDSENPESEQLSTNEEHLEAHCQPAPTWTACGFTADGFNPMTELLRFRRTS